MKSNYLYYGLLGLIFVAIGVVAYLAITSGKQAPKPSGNTGTNTTGATQTSNNSGGRSSGNTGSSTAPKPCTGYTRTSWLADNSIRPGYVRITYCDGTEELVPGVS